MASSIALKNALRYLRSGKLSAAEKIYKHLLQHEPYNAEALHWLGVVAYQRGQFKAAIPLLEKSIELEPGKVIFYNNLGLALHARGSLLEAVQHFQKALVLGPSTPGEREEIQKNRQRSVDRLLVYYEDMERWHFRLGNGSEAAQMARDAGDLWQEVEAYVAAERSYRRALELQPDNERGYECLAKLYLQQKNIPQAIAACYRAIQCQPQSALAYKLLGNCLLARGQDEAAYRAYVKAVQYQPDFAEAFSNIGSLLYKHNQLQRAIAYYEKALGLNPNLHEVYWNLGKVWERQGRLDKAIPAWKRAIEHQPQAFDGKSYYHLASRLVNLGKKEEGIFYLKKAIDQQPEAAIAHWDLCELLGSKSDLSEAREAAERACQECTGTGEILAKAIFIKTHLKSGLSQVAAAQFQKLEPLVYQQCSQLQPHELTKVYLNVLFDMHHLRDGVAENGKLSRYVGNYYGAHLDRQIQAALGNSPRVYPTFDQRRPLRIGFLSRHFRRHSVGWCSADILQELSQLHTEIYLYVTGEMKADDRTALFEKAATKFYRSQRSKGNADAQEIIEQVSRDGIDVLVDLDSLTVLSHIAILRARPAPVCLTWLGYDAPYICDRNYYLSDRFTHPPGVEPHYIEKIIRMPNSFTAISGLQCAPGARETIRRGMRIGKEQVAYLCAAPSFKLSVEMVEAQIQILQAVPNSILLYKARVGDTKMMQQIYWRTCEKYGISYNRIKFMPRTRTEEEHRLLYKIADVLLDSYPYNGATHTLEALWLHLPVITHVGQQSFARMGYSLLHNVGLQAGIAWNWEEYIQKAIWLGKDIQARKAISQQLERSQQPESLAPIWNPKQFASDMYALFRELAQKQAPLATATRTTAP
jgi:predicted O-linked N-acetylglucosamine transferase (SPINDLY family)